MKTIQSKLSGQILVIILLILSVLSIIALTATLNTSRDTQEQQQNKQYQQYYAVGERKIMDMVEILGKQAIGLTDSTINLSGVDFSCGLACGTGLIRTYTNVNPIPPSNYNNSGGTAENLDASLTVEDLLKISGGTTVSINKDQDILLNLSTNTGTIVFDWEGNAGIKTDPVVAWNISYDYKSGNEYKTDKFVWNTSGSGPYGALNTSTGGNSDLGCFRLATNTPSGLIITLQGSCNNQLYLRLKPVTNTLASVTITNLDMTGNTSPIARKISGSTTTSSTGGTNNATKATAVLETTYLLTQSPLSLFDYVLRSEGSVIKN